jgi:anthranilate synthase/aminodeoxychorismate synthase-like glutamine amidotransferase
VRSPLLVIDNYDSFTHNLVDLLEQRRAPVKVVRNDRASVRELLALEPCGVLLSPGPGRPEDAGVCVPLLRSLAGRVPVLGVCLGHQALAAAYGGLVVRARHPLHGSATPVCHRGAGLLAGLPDGFPAARYHSLVISAARPGRGLVPTAWSPDGEIMAVMHREYPVEGVQFHPESHLTPLGPRIVAAFLRRAVRSRPHGGPLLRPAGGGAPGAAHDPVRGHRPSAGAAAAVDPRRRGR